MDLVSIITPTYNSAKYLRKTICSVLDQTYKNWEMIIVDDCSNDNTEEIVNSYKKDNRIKFFKLEHNSGAAIVRNKALSIAKGKYIAFLDSDDIWYKDKLEKQIEFMKKNKYEFSYTNYLEIDEEGNSLKTIVTGPKVINKNMMYRYCWPGCLTVMYNREKIGNIEISDIKKNNDYAMWLKVIKKEKCYLLNEVLSEYRKREGSISNQNKIKLIKWHYYLFKNADNKNTIESIFLVFNNIIFGILKKIKYVKKVKE